MKKNTYIFTALLLLLMPVTVNAMHIAEGFLPPLWSGIYFMISIPFIIIGVKRIRIITGRNKEIIMLLGLVAAYAFILSAMKLPSVTGSSSHPTGTGLSAILFGPFVTSVIGMLVLLFQAIFLAHGGITTLGANTFSMAIAGPLIAYIAYRAFNKINRSLGIFLAAMFGNLTTYMVTSLQLAIAFPAVETGILGAFAKFSAIFSITQLPLAVVEGIVTVIIFDFIHKHSAAELNSLLEG